MTQFKELVALAEKLAGLTSRSEKIALVSSFLRELQDGEVRKAVLILTGRIFPSSEEKRLDVSWSILWSVLRDMAVASDEEIGKALEGAVDGGEAVRKAMESLEMRRQAQLFSSQLTIGEVYSYYGKIASATGKGSRNRKKLLLKSMLSAVTPAEADIIAKSLIGDMRLGFHEGLMEEAVADAFSVSPKLVRRAVMLSGDLSYVASEAKRSGVKALEVIDISLFRPVKPMLAQAIESLGEVLKEMGMASFEFKLDGVRVQIHKSGEKVKIFSRRMTDITSSLPELVEEFASGFAAKEAIIDGEAIAIGEKGRPMPFQYVSRRLRRKRRVLDYAQALPMRLYVFDLLHLDGKKLVDLPYEERRTILKEESEANVIEALITGDEREADEFLQEALRLGHEGLVAKRLNSPYTPGVRGKNWLKMKPTLPELDLVIVAAERGYGRRHEWLSDYYLAARDEESGKFLVVGKTFKGLTDEEFEEMTRRLHEIAISRQGHLIRVQPRIVVEVAFNEVQKSPKYESEMALRFARIKRIRDDKGPEESDTIETVRKIFEKQFESKARPSGTKAI